MRPRPELAVLVAHAVGVSTLALAVGCGPATMRLVGNTPDTDTDLPVAPTCELADEVGPANAEAHVNQLVTVCFGEASPDAPCAGAAALDSWRFLTDALGPTSDPEFCGWAPMGEVCGPEAVRLPECCYVLELGIVCEGRPLMVDGEARVADVVPDVAWSTRRAVATGSLDAPAREALAAAWLRTARAEHASVASFARFTLHLLALGAPAGLVAAAARAQSEEVEHARVAFSMASALSGTSVGPGPLAVDGASTGVDAGAVLAALLVEGCANETLAAAEARAAAEACTHLGLREVLHGIADDEAEHAALAWRAARWLTTRHPELSSQARELAAAACPRVRHAAPVPTGWGHLADEARAALHAAVWRDVVRPAAAVLAA